MIGRKGVAVVGVLVVIAVAAFGAYQTFMEPGGCTLHTLSTPSRYQAQKITFGGIAEYCLAGPSRWANAVAVAQDGSVWFGESSVPGVAHLFGNGTVVEFPWPQGAGRVLNGSYKTGIWGVAIWQGWVWGTDFDGSSIIGVDPATGATRALDLPPSSFPYGLTVGPDDGLWFTTFSKVPYIGRVAPNFSVSLHTLTSPPKQYAFEVQFSPSGLGYYVGLDPFNSTDTGLYSFDPGSPGRINATLLGAGTTLFQLDSLSVGEGTIWAAQHYTSNIAGYSVAEGGWTFWPTSRVNYSSVTLPYFVRAQGHTVWFNEHYANRVARLDPAAGTLTELSESNPPVADVNDIQNDLTIATAEGGLWFTSATGNYLGFVDGSYSQGFGILPVGGNHITISPGGSSSLDAVLSGSWPKGLHISVSDNENKESTPVLVTIVPEKTGLSAGSGPRTLRFDFRAGSSASPGEYIAALTVSDGLVFQSAYVYITVS